MNKTDAFRTKKQLQEFRDNKRSLVKRFGDIRWLVDLKRLKVAEHIRITYINPCSVVNPFKFDYIIDIPKKPVEMMHRSGNRNDDLKHFGKYMKDILKIYNIDIDQYTKQNELVLEVDCLIREEKKRVEPGLRKRYVYNLNNNIIDDEVYKEVYNERLYIKHKNFGIK